MIDKIKKQWFLIGLIGVFAAVVLDPTRLLETVGQFVKAWHGPEIMIFLIFILSGMMLDSEKIKAGIRDVTATFTALLVILVAAPALALILAFYPFEPGVIIGLFIVSVMPTTLSSGVVMTGTAGGNIAHALFVTIVSNIIAIFSIPVVLSLLLASMEMDRVLVIDRTAILLKLLLLVLMPLLAGLCLKSVFRSYRIPEKYPLQMANQMLILSIVFVSVATAKQAIVQDKMSLFPIICLTGIFHLLLFGAAFLSVLLFKVGKGRRESVLFMGAQKTLPLSVMIQISYFSEFGSALVVCVSHHIIHLIIDGYLSTKIGRQE